MKGALVFLLVFFLLGYVTTTNTYIPPGRDLFGLLNIPQVNYPVLGFPLTTFVVSIFNGVVYGVVAWVIYTLLMRGGKKEEVEPRQQSLIKQVMDDGENKDTNQ